MNVLGREALFLKTWRKKKASGPRRRELSEPCAQFFRKRGIILPALSLLLGSWIIEAATVPHEAQAGTGISILETIGVSVAVGAVLGASTLPFYDQPTSHWLNIVYGASAGALTGAGASVYGLLAGSDHQDRETASLSDSPIDSGNPVIQELAKAQSLREVPEPRLNLAQVSPPVTTAIRPIRPVSFWMPVVSVTW